MDGKKKGIYSITHEETYVNGQVIFKEGSAGGWLYIILRGSIETSRDVEGRKFVLERLQPGELIGEIEFVGSLRRTITARAVGETTLGVIDREAIDQEYRQLSKQFKSILETIPARLKKIIDRTCDTSD